MAAIARSIVKIGAIAGAGAAVLGLLTHLDDFLSRCSGQELLQCARNIVTNNRPETGASTPVPQAVQIKIAQFIEWEFLQNKEKYDDPVDFYDRGVVSREEAVKEQRSLSQRFPIRNFKLVPGSMQIVSQASKRYSVTFAFEFSEAASRSATPIIGTGRELVVLRDDGEQFLVAVAKEQFPAPHRRPSRAGANP